MEVKNSANSTRLFKITETKVMEITLNVSDELATRMRPFEDQLPHILELGLREWHAAAQTATWF